MEWISSALGTLSELKAIYKILTEKSRSSNIHKRLIIRELRDNLKKYEQALKNNLSEDSLIDNISNTEIKNGILDDYKFNKLKKGSIQAELIRHTRNKKYIGWTSERLIDKIDEKTEELKNLKHLNGSTVSNLSQTNVGLMLSNQFYRMELLARFIND